MPRSLARGEKCTDPIASVVVIHHKHALRRLQEGYLLSSLASFWSRNGIQVRHLYGTDHFVPADLAILHVDLSVVPKRYANFAACYPRVMNGDVLDIRKRRVSTLSLNEPGEYRGAVIVKTDLNAGGVPERRIRKAREPRVVHKIRSRYRRWTATRALSPAQRITTPAAYEIHSSAGLVPASLYRDRRFVVEKFVPERQGSWYCHRRYYFLGGAEVNQIWLGQRPICANDDDGEEADAPVPGALLDCRRRFGIDYGKIDYVLGPEGEVVIFDVNKTPWAASTTPADRPWLEELCEKLYRGLSTATPPYSIQREPRSSGGTAAASGQG